MHEAQIGDRVRVQYSRKPPAGAADDQRRRLKTCDFTVGGAEVSPTLSLGVVGMTPGDRKQLTLAPPEAFGAVKPRLIREVPRERFPEHIVLRVGQRLISVNARSGRRRRVRVVELQPSTVLVNGNHPLAGQAVDVEVVLISLDSSPTARPNQAPFEIDRDGASAPRSRESAEE